MKYIKKECYENCFHSHRCICFTCDETKRCEIKRLQECKIFFTTKCRYFKDWLTKIVPFKVKERKDYIRSIESNYDYLNKKK